MTARPRPVEQEEQSHSAEFHPDLKRNRSLWDKLQFTEKSATKQITGKGRPMTDINPTWRMLRMTEMFGPCGKGWNWNIEREWESEVGGKKYVYVKLTLWWSDDNGVTRYLVGPHIGGTDMSQGKDEAYKQSVTDAFGKCASMLGVAADVYLGMWTDNDSKYQNEASAAVQAQRNPDLQPESIENFEAELKEKLESTPDLDALQDLWRSGVSARIKEIGAIDKDAQNRLIAAFTARKNKLSETQSVE